MRSPSLIAFFGLFGQATLGSRCKLSSASLSLDTSSETIWTSADSVTTTASAQSTVIDTTSETNEGSIPTTSVAVTQSGSEVATSDSTFSTIIENSSSTTSNQTDSPTTDTTASPTIEDTTSASESIPLETSDSTSLTSPPTTSSLVPTTPTTDASETSDLTTPISSTSTTPAELGCAAYTFLFSLEGYLSGDGQYSDNPESQFYLKDGMLWDYSSHMILVVFTTPSYPGLYPIEPAFFDLVDSSQIPLTCSLSLDGALYCSGYELNEFYYCPGVGSGVVFSSAGLLVNSQVACHQGTFSVSGTPTPFDCSELEQN